MERPIPRRVHGVLDYLTGVLLIALPWVLGVTDDQAAMWVPVVLGAGVILYSLLTNYELGVVKAIPMPVHLGLDAAGGVLLAASPWIFQFADRVWVPFVVIGLFEIVVSLLTQTTSARDTGAGTTGLA